MSHPVPTWASIRPSERLAGTPAVRRGGEWWLVTPTGTISASDPVFTGELDRFAADMAAAYHAVAKLRTERTAARKDRQ
ncbi:hypothetical protein OG895_36965 [Streptomyces sp. NBC_00201]|uniref:hypothetical protein n=1 Tax=unclassified Streptomyces TaxID=2593676 RepID=UPI00224EBE6D|nr:MULTISPECIES: hypothetical protein [unclassified Streptomyces]MCX5250727.1 hypothetical protein [Streptomyces sp. NBC_00201]MCX5291344.1 hypothetical protein [Streptomyces sp. NBC_00183]